MGVSGNVRTRWRRGRQAGVIGGCLILALAGCASTGGPAATPSPSNSATATPSNATAPTGTPTVPSLSVLPLPGTSGSAASPITLQGTVTEGVESGCVLLTDESGAIVANLQGWDLQAHPLGSQVDVTGTFEPDLMTTCQQGMPFEVISATSR